MYKAQLQEMCYRRRWGLPQYWYMKDGPDHCPRFKASVTVNGESFNSPPKRNSSKEALNDAARIALLHFKSPIGASTDDSWIESTKISSGSEKPLEIPLELAANDLSIINAVPSTAGGGLKKEEASASPIIQVMDELHFQYKTRLQTCARLKNLALPLYYSKSEGPSHKPAFKATVTVGGNTFESPGFFKTVKEAEHAAAKAAFMSMYPDGVQVADSAFYKSLLQEFTQRENLSIPIYKTAKSGTPHMPTFTASVEVEGQLFHGKEGKSKKEAEAKAAEAAYNILRQRSLNSSSTSSSPGLGISEPTKSASSSDSPAIVDSQHTLKDKVRAVSSATLKVEKQHDEQSKDKVREICSAEISPDSSKDSTVFPETTSEVKLNGNKDSPPPRASTKGSLPIIPDASALSKTEPSSGNPTRVRSYLLGNKVRVYPCFPNIALPKGITILPISDTQWIPVSLEFPKENPIN